MGEQCWGKHVYMCFPGPFPGLTTKGLGLSPSLTLVVGAGPIMLTLAHVSKSYIMEYTWIEN